jgi:hypothetical protein
VAPRPKKDKDFFEGVRHGFTFGDGTLYNDGAQARANFCGTKDQEMLRYFEGHGSPPITGEPGVIMVHGLPSHYKSMPANGSTASYWYGFVVGLLAADGSVDVNGCSVITQASQATLDAVADQLARIGMVGGRVRGYWRETEYGEGDMHYLSLFKQYMQEGDFLLAEHRANFVRNFKATNYGHHVHVKAVRETGIEDEVFCCREEETSTFTIGNGILTGNCYGNCFISIFYPFLKWLVCKACKHKARVEQVDYRFTNFNFTGACRKCGHFGDFGVEDQHVRSVREIRMIRWDPEQITIQHNEATGENQYFYTIPPRLSNDIRMGKRTVIEKTPQIFIDALKKNKSILFSNENLFHLKRPTIAQKDKGWGLPMILPVLKDTFYLQILRKAQEAIAVEHIVPLRLLFPQIQTGTSDPYTTVNISTWKLRVEQEILRWRLDNNYIPIMPLPMGQQTLGGEGRALMLAQEYRVWAEHIVAGMGVPIEFVFGGMQYSGSNVSMRILENKFLDYKADHQALVQDFIMPRVGAFMGWAPVKTHFKKFKMADDIQRAAFNLQLNQAGKLSDRSMLEESDWDSRSEAEQIGVEQGRNVDMQRRQAESQAQIQGETQLILQKYQLRAQKAMMEQTPAPPEEGPAVDGMEPFGSAGVPGQASPGAMGEAALDQQAAALMAGQVEAPPIAEGAQGGTQAGESQLSTESVMQGAPPDSVGIDLRQMADKVARWLDGLPDNEKQVHLVTLQTNNPQLYLLVSQMLRERQGAHTSSAAMAKPEARAPRRGPEATIG